MDQAAVSRASSLGVTLKVDYQHRFPSGPNGEYLPSYQVAVSCQIEGRPKDVAATLDHLRKFQTPAPIRKIEGWLAELSVITARRSDDGFAEALRIDAYSSRLSRYPADVVHAALFERTYKFWPTWDELKKVCETLAAPRNLMILALQRGPAKPEPERRPPTDTERKNIQELVDQTFPLRSREMRAAAVDEVLKGHCMMKAAAEKDQA